MFTLNCKGRLLVVDKPLIMGIINATPDSFFGGNRFSEVNEIVAEVDKMVKDGADIIDIGGQSTRPGSELIPVDEEIKRVIPAIKAIAEKFPEAVISIDTFYSKVAIAAVNAGATIINDISAGSIDEKMIETVAQLKTPYILMHIKGTPQTMQQNAAYENVTREVLDFFIAKTYELKKAGILDIIIDPGFGFAKTMEQNYQIINGLEVFSFLGCPVMVGISRKSTLSKTINRPVEETLEATTALHMVALQNGASILRAHDVQAAMDAMAIFHQTQWVNTLNNKSLSQA